MLHTHSENLLPMDSLPAAGWVDLSLASAVIPADLFAQIAQFITQIDLTLFGMRNGFDPQNACLAPLGQAAWSNGADFADFSQGGSPIASNAADLNSIVVHTTDFAS
ncbi:MAG TPA: hypothetical protein VFV57_12385 [Limnobacter sp.]|nr:hypothetical protein [Limnobacter sp.]